MLRSVVAISFLTLGVVALSPSAAAWNSAELAGLVRSLELKGDLPAARRSLQDALRANPRDPEILALWARFLDQRRDPDTRSAYQQLLALPALHPDLKRDASRRLDALNLIAGQNSSSGPV